MSDIDSSKPLTPIECPYCAFWKDAQEHREKIVYEGERVVLFTVKTTRGFDKQGVVITKRHCDDLSSASAEDIWEALILARKFSHSFWTIHPSIKGFKYESSQGDTDIQKVKHFSITITPL